LFRQPANSAAQNGISRLAAPTKNLEAQRNLSPIRALNEQLSQAQQRTEVDMGFGRGILFWLLGVPIPIIILLALFWHH
jgi:hypothetical protein